MTTHLTVGSIVQLTHTGSATEPPARPLDGVHCPRCNGFGWVFVTLARVAPHKPETVKEVCPMCHGTGEPQDGHLDSEPIHNTTDKD
jgi:DnaJ-class molecular chaperone